MGLTIPPDLVSIYEDAIEESKHHVPRSPRAVQVVKLIERIAKLEAQIDLEHWKLDVSGITSKEG